MSKELGPVLDPVLTQIVNMDLTKKDILEILEMETLRDIESESDTQIKIRQTIIDELNAISEEFTKNTESIKTKIIESWQKKIPAVFGKVEVKVDFEPIRSKDGSEEIINFKARIRGEGNLMSFGRGCEYIYEPLDEKFQNRLKEKYEREKQLNERLSAQNTIVQEIDQRKYSLPKTMKEFSAELSKKALEGTDKGKGVLSLLQSIRQKSRAIEIECKEVKTKKK